MDVVTVSAEQALHTLTKDARRQAGTVDTAGVVVVQVSGEVDLYTGPRLRTVLQDLLAAPTAPPSPTAPEQPEHTPCDQVSDQISDQVSNKAGEQPPTPPAGSARQALRAVVIDLTEVSFMDSFTLGVLVHGHRLARPRGLAYALIATSDLIRGLFAVTGLARVMPLHQDLPTALTNLQPARPAPAS